MPLSRHRRLVALAAGVLLLSPLTACGGSGNAKDAQAPGTSTSSPTTGSSGSSTPGSTPGTAVSGTAINISDFVGQVVAAIKAKRSAHMGIKLGSSISAVADISYVGGTAMKMAMSTGAQKLRVVLVNGTMYLQQSAGGKYLRIDKNDPTLGSLVAQLSNIGPAASLSAMEPGIKSIVDAGGTTLDGRAVTHYVMTVDTKLAAAAFGAAANAVKPSDPATVTYNLYLDSDKLLVEMTGTVSDQKFTMTASGWGKPVNVAAPAASDITKK
ncbi:MAG: LppX LprAFG lipoprotein [Marmoricola sp.]|nr:LppX LprAFG lipoprotein [Marmoricola sp.]